MERSTQEAERAEAAAHGSARFARTDRENGGNHKRLERQMALVIGPVLSIRTGGRRPPSHAQQPTPRPSAPLRSLRLAFFSEQRL